MSLDPNDKLIWDRLDTVPAVTEYHVALCNNGVNLNVAGSPQSTSIIPQPASGDPEVTGGVLIASIGAGAWSVQVRAKVSTGHFTLWSDPALFTFTDTIEGTIANLHEVDF